MSVHYVFIPDAEIAAVAAGWVPHPSRQAEAWPVLRSRLRTVAIQAHKEGRDAPTPLGNEGGERGG